MDLKLVREAFRRPENRGAKQPGARFNHLGPPSFSKADLARKLLALGLFHPIREAVAAGIRIGVIDSLEISREEDFGPSPTSGDEGRDRVMEKALRRMASL